MRSAQRHMPERVPARFTELARDVLRRGGWRLVGLAALTAAAVMAEGIGLLLLVPLLQGLGMEGSAPWQGIGPLGLEGALALYVVLVAAGAVVVMARGTATTAFRFEFVDDLRRRLHHGLVGVEWRAFGCLQGGRLLHTLTHDTAQAGQAVEFLLRCGAWAVEIPVLLGVAMRLSPAMTAATLVLAALFLVAIRPLNRRIHAQAGRVVEAGQALHGDLADDLAGMRVIRGLGLEAERSRRVDERMAAVRVVQMGLHRATGLAQAAVRTAGALAVAVATWVALRVVGMALAETMVLMAAFARLLVAAQRMQDSWRTVLSALPAHAAAAALLESCRHADMEPVVGAGTQAPPLAHAIRLEGVGFRHAPGHAPALADVHAEIPALAVTALVGRSGAGKSTLTDLLLGLTEPDQGQVLVDGRPLRGPFRAAWRRRVGYVPQDAFLFHDTIRANLVLAAPDADDAALWAVLERVVAADFVRALPDGLMTVVGDRGARLSGGQRQRLLLARALLSDPVLLILDEPTSALDAESERHVLATLDALRGRLTMVVVAHRPSTVHGADYLVGLEGGRVVVAGGRAEVEHDAPEFLARLGMMPD